MTSPQSPRVRTRRQFLGDVIRATVGIAALAALGPQAAAAAPASQGRRPERVKVLVEDIVEATAADFARGQSRGVAVVERAGRASLRGSAGGQFISGVVALSFPATDLGLHWFQPDGSLEAVSAAIRTSSDRHNWSDWYELSVEAFKDRPEGREVFAALAPGERGRFVQYEFTLTEAASVEQVTVTSLNSVDGPREALPAATPMTVTLTAPGGPSLAVITREGWSCDESLGSNGGGEIWPEMYVPAKKVVIHHTATSNTYTDGAAQVRSVYTYHAKTQGWGDIGYNLLIDHSGNVYEGRHSRGNTPLADGTSTSREVAGPDVVAGHDLYYNYGTTGISCLGDFSRRPYNSVSGIKSSFPALLPALDRATAFECARHYIYPLAGSDFLTCQASGDVWSSDLWGEEMANISGHRDTNSTACPGAGLYAYLGDLRTNVAATLAAGKLASPTGDDAPPLSVSVSGRQLTYSWRNPATRAFSRFNYCLEGWYRLANSENIVYVTKDNGFYVDAGYTDDALDLRMNWAATDGTTFTYALPETLPRAGQFTFHVRGEGGLYAAHLTLKVDAGGVVADPLGQMRTVHVADLDRQVKVKGRTWEAVVTATVLDAAGQPVSGATVSAQWSGAKTGSVSGTTGSAGTVALSSGSISGTSVTLTVMGVSGSGLTYDASSNGDPDGDSDGTTIAIVR